MRKILTSLVLTLMIATSLLPTTAHAANTFMLGMSWMYGVFDFAAQGVQNGDVIVLTDEAQHVTLRGDSSTTYNNIMINIPSTGGTYFTIENLNITGPGGDNNTPLVVHGTGNTMEVLGTCNFISPYDVGIQVEDDDALTITGTGTLNVRSGYSISVAGAGIGGRYTRDCGTVNINGSVNVHVEGGYLSAGIGGGGGTHPFSGYVMGGKGGSVNISGDAVVYALGEWSDIGAGYDNPNSGTLSISGNAAVFLRYNEPAIVNYTNMSSSHNYLAGSYKFGYSVTGTVGASITTKSLYAITYNANGGTGSQSTNYQQEATIALSSGTAFSRAGYTLAGWADSTDGIKDYDLSAAYTMPISNVTLYAAWSPYDIEYNLYGGTNSSSNPTTYETSGAPITLYAPSKDASTFLGWYDGADFSVASLLTEIPAGTAGNLAYYAKWNTLPTLSTGVAESASPSVTINTQYRINLADIFTDTDGDTLSYQVKINGTPYTTTSVSLVYTPTSVGLTDFLFKANDGIGDSVKTYHVILHSTEAEAAATKTKNTTSSTITHDPNITPTPIESATSAPVESSSPSISSEIITPSPATPSQTSVPEEVQETDKDESIPFWVWILGGIAAAFWAVFGLARIFRVKTNPRYTRR